MPQLDKFTFASQIFWLFVIFFCLYVLLLKFVLPTILAILRTRRWKISKLMRDESILKILESSLFEANNQLVVAITNVTKDFFQKANNELESFIQASEKSILTSVTMDSVVSLYSELTVESQLKIEQLLFEKSDELNLTKVISSFFDVKRTIESNSIEVTEEILDFLVEKEVKGKKLSSFNESDLETLIGNLNNIMHTNK